MVLASPMASLLGGAKTPTQNDKCMFCKSIVKEGATGLQCDMCDRWSHVFITDAQRSAAASRRSNNEPKCNPMTQAGFDRYDDEKDGQPYFCSDCGRAAKKVIKKLKSFDQDIDELKTNHMLLEEKVEKNAKDAAEQFNQHGLQFGDFDTRLSALEKANPAQPAPAITPPSFVNVQQIQQNAVRRFQFVEQERNQRDVKRLRLCMFRKPESEGETDDDRVAKDLEDVRDYAAAMGLSKDVVVEVKRDKKMSGCEMRILKISFTAFEKKIKFLTDFGSKKIELGTWPPGIWVREDYTELQQAQAISLSSAAQKLSSGDGTQRRIVTVRGRALYERRATGHTVWRRLIRETMDALAVANEGGLPGVTRFYGRRAPLAAATEVAAAGAADFGRPPDIDIQQEQRQSGNDNSAG
jgi:hypothetical protein